MLLAALLIAQLEVAPEHHLNRARVCMGVLDFECAEQELSAVRRSLDQIEPALAIEALSLSAEAALSTARFSDAEAHLVELLIRSPKFAPKEGAWPPRWLEVLAAAKRKIPDQAPPQVQVKLTSRRVPPGIEIAVRAQIDDASGVDRATLELIDPPARIAMTSTGGVFLGVIPAERARPPGVRFYVEAFDVHQNGPARSGEEMIEVSEPVTIATAPPEPEPGIAEQWWFWTLLGVVVVGSAATAVALTAGSDDSGTVTARFAWPQR